MDQAEARKQRAHKGSHRTQKKSDDMHNKIKRVNSVGTFMISDTGCGQYKTQMLYFWLWTTQFKCCIFGCGQPNSNAVFLAMDNQIQMLYFWLWKTQIKYCFLAVENTTQMLYFWLWTTQFKCCIFGYGQPNSNAVFLAVEKTTQMLYFWLWKTQLKCCIFGCGQPNSSAVFLTVDNPIQMCIFGCGKHNLHAVFLVIARYCIGVFQLSFRGKYTK